MYCVKKNSFWKFLLFKKFLGVFGQFLPINGAGDICYVSTSNRVWNFPQWESPPATAVVNVTKKKNLGGFFSYSLCKKKDDE